MLLVCTGKIWLSAAAILATFNIVQKKDEHGRNIPVGVKYTDGIIRYDVTCMQNKMACFSSIFSSIPYGFQFALVPRSEDARQIILDCRKES